MEKIKVKKKISGILFDKEVIAKIEAGKNGNVKSWSVALTWCGTCPGDDYTCGNVTMTCP